MDLEHGSGSSKHSRTHAESTVNEADPLVPAGKKLGSHSSTSSSLSSSSSADLFQVDTNLATPSKTKSQEDGQLELKDENDRVFSGPASPSQVFDLGQQPSFHCMSPTQSPPVQSMERSGDDEPYRIPSSVFARSQSTTPVEWSIASNDSLFSIHVGNNSFSREHIFMLGGDHAKSGELTKSGELIVFSSSPPGQLEENFSKSVDTEKDLETTAVASEPIKGDVPVPVPPTSADQNSEKIAQPEVPSHSSSVRRSDASATSTQSFAFPIKKKCAWPSCYCSNFSRAFCYCTWPRCYCSNCSWAFCYFWNCSGHCCFSSTILTEGDRNVSIKKEPEKTLSQKQPQPTATEATSSDAATSNWLSCACCPYKCC